jgi:hypothetical protein
MRMATALGKTKMNELAIFAGFLNGAKGMMAPSLARHVLTLGFTAEEQGHIEDLAARNQSSATKSP